MSEVSVGAERHRPLAGAQIDGAKARGSLPVMAWHILTVLGDALWRTDAGIVLPGGGGTPSSWADELDTRLRSILQQ